MRKSTTVLLSNLFLQLFLLNASSASLSSLTSNVDDTTNYELSYQIEDGEEEYGDNVEAYSFDDTPLLMMEIEEELHEDMIERYLNGTAPKHPPKNNKKPTSGGSSGGGGGGSSGGGSGSSGGGSGSSGSGSGSSSGGGGGGGSSSRSSGASSGSKSGNNAKAKPKPKALSSGFMMYGMAAVAVAGVAAVYQNQNREIVVEGEPHALQGSIARRMARFDKMAGKASPEARGAAGMVEMSSSSFSDGDDSCCDNGSTIYVNMESNSNNNNSNSSHVSMNSSTGGGHAMAMV
mmetsp:Transcript_3527/g.4339  ORF Transcript_3527/g.4339 Transcript_3527/m.4339 type:complete len:290 (-) Transcript_3527:319-1188(-)|eukprot:CAMPEP_0203652426 /NCGR_PEP_ID=MMETSP0088-20131115/30108_1 /ASSEMBLY_ACC=CAM_ASM_001087 /TAXON_ID=426623 /ORGANISM="Chaetoceros affinis, Strain CCMP159" /LENGTH=289 /DNA_ID=CAMNT_0050511963 /DNA_START=263 /DNA_END=1132 /DNA_ORIENTATION=-